MYTFFAYLILLLHISTWSLAQDVEITPIYEICDYLEEHVDHSTVIPLTIDQAAEDRTFKCVERYSVTIETQEQAENYLIVEVYAYSQDPSFDTYLATNTKTRPEIWYNNSERIINETYDVNANVYRKSYHHITYRPTSLKIGKTIYFSLYDLPTDDGTPLVSATYSISVKSTPVYPCPQSCSGNGYCDENLEKCICNRTYFDEDCTVQATEIIEGQFTGRDFPVEDYQLFFFEVLNSADDLQLSYTKTQGEIALGYTMNRQNTFNLPNYDGRIISNNITYDAKQSYFNIFQQALSYRSVLLLEVTNTGTVNTVTFQAKVDKFVDTTPNRNTLMVIMIGVSAFFIISWGVLTLVKFKNHRQAETLLQARNVNGPEQRDLLSKEDLDKFFKKKKYRECQSSFPQNTCSICLEDFHGESVCRQLYCEHAYHATCIESWLSQHNSCPNCKKDMTKAAIEEYLASPKLLDEIKEEEEMEKKDRVDGVKMVFTRSLAPLEEIKEDYARSLNDIIIQHKDERISKKMSESLTGPPLERKGSSLRGTPKYLEPRPGFMNRKIDEMYRKNTQDPMDFEERDVREKSDMNNSIMLRMNQNKSRNISEINPLNRRSMEKNSADEDSHF